MLDQRFAAAFAGVVLVSATLVLLTNLLVDVSYVGNHSVKARRGINLDQPVNGRLPTY